MTPAQAGEYDRHLGLLLQRNELTGTEFAILNRMFWSLRSRGSDQTQATLDLIMARTGACRDKVVQAVRRAIELDIMVKLRSTVRRVINGVACRVNGANVYVFRMPDPVEPEIEIAVVHLPQTAGERDHGIVPESENRTTFLKAIEDSTLSLPAGLYPREQREGAHASELVSPGETMAGTDGGGEGNAVGHRGGPPPGAAMEPRRSAVDPLGGGLPDGDGSRTSDLSRQGEGKPEAMGQDPADPGQAGRGAGGGDGTGGGSMSTDLLAARVKAARARLLEPGGQPRRTAPEAPQTPGDALTARARATRGRLLAAYQNRRGKAPDGSGGG